MLAAVVKLRAPGAAGTVVAAFGKTIDLETARRVCAARGRFRAAAVIHAVGARL